MTKVAIVPVATSTGVVSYRAVAGEKQSEGKTAGEALDALTRQLGEEESGMLVIVQNQRADRFFSAEQQQRLAELMRRWRQARDSGVTLEPAEQAELDELVDAELRGATERARGLLDELGR